MNTSPESTEPNHNTPTEDDFSGGCILVVDDVPTNVRVLAGILKIAGYDTLSASSGPEALELLQSQTPDVVLLDVMMPGMDGFEVCRHIRSDPARAFLPVVMVTALHETGDRIKALECGADDFLTKPVDDVEVLARVKSLVRVKRQRDALTQAYLDLQSLESLRDSLTMMLVHDLRTPLTTILGPLEMLQTGQFGGLEEVQKEIVAMSLRSGYRLLGLVNELLDVSKMESGEMTLHRSEVKVPDVVQDAVELVAKVNTNDMSRIQYGFEDDLPPISADEDLLRRVLVNLVANAMKFTRSDGTVTVSAARAGTSDADSGTVIISVSDEGEGIPPEDRERIFEKFGQVESRRAGRKMSTGLGLTFCKLAVEAHGGRIWVESEMGKGSTFHCTIPQS
ncbi:MAG TPA: response regulator [Abditibacteriaceae bacterium]|jgi:signal transduction histidine kinase